MNYAIDKASLALSVTAFRVERIGNSLKTRFHEGIIDHTMEAFN